MSLTKVSELYTFLQSQKSQQSQTNQTELGDDILKQIDWCTKCKNFFAKTTEVARRKDLIVKGGIYQTKIDLSCSKGHLISISY